MIAPKLKVKMQPHPAKVAKIETRKRNVKIQFLRYQETKNTK